MREIHPKILSWLEGGRPWVLATVVKAGRPAPRGAGAVMAIRPDEQLFHGSVSAGCVEAVVVETALKTLGDGKTRWERFSGEAGFPWEVGMSCGGQMTVRLDRIDPALDSLPCTALATLLQEGVAGTLVMRAGRLSVFSEGEAVGAWGDDIQSCLACFKESGGPVAEYDTGGGMTLLYQIVPPRRLFIVGAGHIALHLVPIAHHLGLETVVIDPRDAYLREERFLERPHRVHRDWPRAAFAAYRLGAQDAAVLLTHDPKIDDEALAVLLSGSCGYIGALGSVRSHEARRRRLERLGFAEADLSRVDAPVGIHIGSRTPAEIAISIAAGLIQHQHEHGNGHGVPF
ncbi:MAG: Molybdenum cofactor insertion chaperone PaoD [Verrucomicrobiota bacterium]